MRYSASEKLEIIRTVEDSSLGIGRTLQQIEHQVAGTQKWLKDDQATPCRAVLAHCQSEKGNC